MEYIGNAYKDIIDVESIHFTDVIKAIYFVSIDNVDEAEKAINNAMIMKRQLEKEELYACIIISTLVNIKRQKYNDALEIIKTIEHTYLGDIVLEKLYCVKCFLSEQLNRKDWYYEICQSGMFFSKDSLFLEKELFVDTDVTNNEEFPVFIYPCIENVCLADYIYANIDNAAVIVQIFSGKSTKSFLQTYI